MELILSAKLENLFKAKDYKDKTTGEVKSGKWQGQFFEETDTEEGKQLTIHKISIPAEKVHFYKGKVGEVVEVPVKAYAYQGKVGFYGV